MKKDLGVRVIRLQSDEIRFFDSFKLFIDKGFIQKKYVCDDIEINKSYLKLDKENYERNINNYYLNIINNSFRDWIEDTICNHIFTKLDSIYNYIDSLEYNTFSIINNQFIIKFNTILKNTKDYNNFLFNICTMYKNSFNIFLQENKHYYENKFNILFNNYDYFQKYFNTYKNHPCFIVMLEFLISRLNIDYIIIKNELLSFIEEYKKNII